MDEAWERAVEAALAAAGGESPARSLTLDGVVKCPHGRLPAASILERHQSLEHLSIAGVGVASLAGFPRLRNLTRLTLSDNRIAGGLDYLVAAGLAALRDLDLSNNRIGCLDDLAPLAHLRLVSLDLYECPVTRVKDYRSRVFGMIRTLKYLDKMDADENERPESDDEDDDEDGDDDDVDVDEEEEEEDDVEDPGSGEVDGDESRGWKPLPELNGAGNGMGNVVIDVGEDESDADEEEGVSAAVVPTRVVDEEEEEEDDDEEDEDYEDYEEDLGEEIDEENVVEVHDVASSEEDVDGVEEEDEEENEETAVDEEDEEEADVEDEEEAEDGGLVSTTGRRTMVVEGNGGEIDGHEQGEDDDDGEIGEAEEDEQLLGVEEDERVYEEGNGDDEDDDEV